MNKPIHTVLFDLDGTLVDTAPDLAAALNNVLLEQGCQPLGFAEIRPIVSLGGKAMLNRAFPALADTDPTEFERLRQRFLTFYSEHLADNSRLFYGMADVLSTLEALKIQWGIVTNKPTWLTNPLLERLNLASRSICAVSGDTLPQAKPHPAPLLHAASLAGSTPEQCIYVGDALRDIEAGQRAGMRTVVALYGYIEATEQPEQWGATCMINNPLELLEIMNLSNQKVSI